MDIMRLFHGSKTPKIGSAVTRNNIAQSKPTRNCYGIQSDMTYYALLCYTGVVLDERINSDVEYFKEHYFSQDCACLSMWFKDEDASPYIHDKSFLVAPSQRYFCFFNNNALQSARTQDGTVIYYPKSMNECYCFQSVGPNGITLAYRVLRDKAKQLPQPLDYNYMLAQFIGYVIKPKQGLDNKVTTTTEFIYAYALDIQ